MHDGCAGTFESDRQIADKVRQMGFSNQPMPIPMSIQCVQCHDTFEMVTFEDKCPKCDMVYAVVPCHAFDPANVKPAGINY